MRILEHVSSKVDDLCECYLVLEGAIGGRGIGVVDLTCAADEMFVDLTESPFVRSVVPDYSLRTINEFIDSPVVVSDAIHLDYNTNCCVKFETVNKLKCKSK